MTDPVMTYFAEQAKSYDTYSRLASDRVLQERLRAAIGQVQNSRVLDVGAGTGKFGLLFAGPDNVVVGLDACLPMLYQATDPLSRVCGDARGLPFASKTFDVVLTRQILQYLRPADIRRVLTSIRGVLKGGGRFVVHQTTAPSRAAASALARFMAIEGLSVHYLTLDELRRTLRGDGFEIIAAERLVTRVSETINLFCANRRIDLRAAHARLDRRHECYPNEVMFDGQTVSYSRHYALVVAAAVRLG